MSDFLTRLVARQAGTVAMVQPRTPSMFAPQVSRTTPVGLPVRDSSSPVDEVGRTPAAALRSGDRGNKVLIVVDQQEEQRPVSGPRSAPRDGTVRRPDAAPAPLVRNASAVVNRPPQAAPPAPRIGSVSIHEQWPPKQTGLGERNSADGVDTAFATRIELPPRLIDSRHDMTRSAASAPPSLASDAVMGRRTEPTRAVPPEAPVEVTIGRIEVTAVSTTPDQNRKSSSRRPAMSLEEYLTRRQGGKP